MLTPLLAVGMAACGVEPNESIDYQRLILVSNFDLIREGYSKSAFGVYVGSAKVSLVDSVSGPGLTLAAGPVDLSNGSFKYIAEGRGRADSTGDCWVWLYSLDSDPSTVEYAGADRLTPAQRAGVLDGSLVVIRLNVLCDAQADG